METVTVRVTDETLRLIQSGADEIGWTLDELLEWTVYDVGRRVLDARRQRDEHLAELKQYMDTSGGN